MNLKFLTIGIKGTSLEELETTLLDSGIQNHFDKISEMFAIQVTIKDLREEYVKMSKFLEDNGLNDENPFFNEFEINSFGLQIDFNFTANFKYLDVLEPIIFILGQHVSLSLKTECIVMFDNMKVPAGLYNMGTLTETFEKYNSVFFKRRIWTPNRSVRNF